MSVKRQSVAAGLRVVQRDRGAAGYALLRAAVSHVAGLGIADLGALVELGERGLLVEMLRGTSPANSEAEAFDKLVSSIGPDRVEAFIGLVETLRRMDAPSLRAASLLVAQVAQPTPGDGAPN